MLVNHTIPDPPPSTVSAQSSLTRSVKSAVSSRSCSAYSTTNDRAELQRQDSPIYTDAECDQVSFYHRRLPFSHSGYPSSVVTAELHSDPDISVPLYASNSAMHSVRCNSHLEETVPTSPQGGRDLYTFRCITPADLEDERFLPLAGEEGSITGTRQILQPQQYSGFRHHQPHNVQPVVHHAAPLGNSAVDAQSISPLTFSSLNGYRRQDTPAVQPREPSAVSSQRGGPRRLSMGTFERMTGFPASLGSYVRGHRQDITLSTATRAHQRQNPRQLSRYTCPPVFIVGQQQPCTPHFPLGYPFRSSSCPNVRGQPPTVYEGVKLPSWASVVSDCPAVKHSAPCNGIPALTERPMITTSDRSRGTTPRQPSLMPVEELRPMTTMSTMYTIIESVDETEGWVAGMQTDRQVESNTSTAATADPVTTSTSSVALRRYSSNRPPSPAPTSSTQTMLADATPNRGRGATQPFVWPRYLRNESSLPRSLCRGRSPMLRRGSSSTSFSSQRPFPSFLHGLPTRQIRSCSSLDHPAFSMTESRIPPPFPRFASQEDGGKISNICSGLLTCGQPAIQSPAGQQSARLRNLDTRDLRYKRRWMRCVCHPCLSPTGRKESPWGTAETANVSAEKKRRRRCCR